jgi:16S rRNA processing protein RimM
VKGWVKLHSYTNPIENLLDYLPWYITKAKQELCIEKIVGKRHGKLLIVHFDSCNSPEEAKEYTNLDIAVDRSQLPVLSKEEYYWVDLIGLVVLNQEGITLGTVERLFETGSNDVLIVKEENGKERYIPYTDDVVQKVDLAEKKLLVDWDEDF